MLQHGPSNDTLSYPTVSRTSNLTHERNLRYAWAQGRACPARREREEEKKWMQGGSHYFNLQKIL
jgi:hypothetical protein